MVLSLSDQDSAQHSPNADGNEATSMPSPGSHVERSPSPPPQHRSSFGDERSSSARDAYDDVTPEPSPTRSAHDAPIDFSVRRADAYESERLERMERISNNLNHRFNTDDMMASKSNGDMLRDRTLPPFPYGKHDKIGEPRLGLPGLPHGVPLPPFPGQFPPGFPLNMMANFNMLNNLAMRHPDTKSLTNGQSDKQSNARPFKAYPKDPLSLPLGYFGLPGVPPLPGIDVNQAQAASQVNSEEMFKQYRELLLKRAEQDRHERKRKPSNEDTQQPLSPTSGTPSKPPLHLSMGGGGGGGVTALPPAIQQSLWPKAEPVSSPVHSNGSYNSNDNITDTDTKSPTPSLGLDCSPRSIDHNIPPRKRGRSNSDGTVIKDEAYWERRRKNNEAAKRSRDSRRAKEDEIAIRAAFLEQENLKLRVEVTALKNETAKLRCMLYNS